MRPFAVAFLLFLVVSAACTGKRVTYTPYEGERQWVAMGPTGGDGAAFFVRAEVDSNLLFVRAEVTLTSSPEDLRQLSMEVEDMDTTGSTYSFSFSDEHTQLSTAADGWASGLAALRSSHIDITSGGTFMLERRYVVGELPEVVHLGCRLQIRDSLIAHSVKFKREETDAGSTMRWH